MLFVLLQAVPAECQGWPSTELHPQTALSQPCPLELLHPLQKRILRKQLQESFIACYKATYGEQVPENRVCGLT